MAAKGDFSEFRGSTGQALLDIRGDIAEVKGMLSSLEQKFLTKAEGIMTDKVLARHDEDISNLRAEVSNLKNWRIYLSGAWAALMLGAVFFGDQIRAMIFGRN